MKNSMSTPITTLKLLTRESLLDINSELIEQLQKRLKAKRFRAQEGDSLKLAYIRAFIQALQVQNTMLKDLDIDEFQKRLEALENSQAQNGCALANTPLFTGVE
jgi:hypothetical protein